MTDIEIPPLVEGKDHFWDRKTGDGKFRFALYKGVSRRPLLWICMNPSFGDRNEKDPTIRAIMEFSKQRGYDSWALFNLYPSISRRPSAMPRPLDPERIRVNTALIERAVTDLDGDAEMVYAWGKHRVLSEKSRPKKPGRGEMLAGSIIDIDHIVQRNGVRRLRLPRSRMSRSVAAVPWHPRTAVGKLVPFTDDEFNDYLTHIITAPSSLGGQ